MCLLSFQKKKYLKIGCLDHGIPFAPDLHRFDGNGCKMNRDPKKKPEQKQQLPSITKGPVGERRGECSGLPATLRSNLSVETTHLSRGSANPWTSRKICGVNPVPPTHVRGFAPWSMKCQRCHGEDAAFRVFTDAMDIHVCPSCAEEARQLEIATEDLPNADPKNDQA